MEDERHVPAVCSIGVLDVYQDKSWSYLLIYAICIENAGLL